MSLIFAILSRESPKYSHPASCITSTIGRHAHSAFVIKWLNAVLLAQRYQRRTVNKFVAVNNKFWKRHKLTLYERNDHGARMSCIAASGYFRVMTPQETMM